MTRVPLDDGFALNVERSGAGEQVVLLHGFTGSAGSWGEFGSLLARSHELLAIDIVGHGASDSPRELEHYRMERCAEDLVEVIRRLGVDRAHWLGYSMGARTALTVADAFPNVVHSLTLIGGSPGLACVEDRIARRSADDLLAARIERDGVEAFVDYWESIPLFASQAALPAAVRAALREGRLRNDATGLANSLRGMGTGAQPSLHERLATIAAPALVLAGALDTKFVLTGDDMAQAMPDARIAAVPGAGHAAQLEQPLATASLVLEFLAEHPISITQGVAP